MLKSSRVKWDATSFSVSRLLLRNTIQGHSNDTTGTMVDYKSYLAANILSEDKVVCLLNLTKQLRKLTNPRSLIVSSVEP
jgi:hypothetical protein